MRWEIYSNPTGSEFSKLQSVSLPPSQITSNEITRFSTAHITYLSPTQNYSSQIDNSHSSEHALSCPNAQTTCGLFDN